MLCYEFPPLGGGGSKVVEGLSAQLSDLGHEIHLVTTRFGDCPAYEEQGNVSIWRVGSLRRRLDRSNVLELASYVVVALVRAMLLLRRNRYDICHAHFIFPDGIVAWFLRLFMNQNFVVTAHGSDVPGLQSASLHVGASFVESFMASGFDCRRLHCLPLGIPAKPFGVELPRVQHDDHTERFRSREILQARAEGGVDPLRDQVVRA